MSFAILFWTRILIAIICLIYIIIYLIKNPNKKKIFKNKIILIIAIILFALNTILTVTDLLDERNYCCSCANAENLDVCCKCFFPWI